MAMRETVIRRMHDHTSLKEIYGAMDCREATFHSWTTVVRSETYTPSKNLRISLFRTLHEPWIEAASRADVSETPFEHIQGNHLTVKHYEHRYRQG